jgi:hypothetical protein
VNFDILEIRMCSDGEIGRESPWSRGPDEKAGITVFGAE